MIRDDMDEHHHPLAGSPARFAATLIAALIGTSPAFRAAIEGDMTLPEAVGRFLVAFAVFWVVGSVVSYAFRRVDASERMSGDVVSDDLAGGDVVDGSSDVPSAMSEMVPGSAAAER